MSSIMATTLAALSIISHVTAAPYAAPQGEWNPVPCEDLYDVVVESQTPVIGEHFGFQSTVASGDDMTYTKTHTITKSWTVGGSIDISKIIGVGLDASVSESVAQGSSEALGVHCPEGGLWTCGGTMAPSMLEVEGYSVETGPESQGCSPGYQTPFTVQIPMKDDDGLPIIHLDPVCACPEYEHWADAGAPSVVCPPGSCGL